MSDRATWTKPAGVTTVRIDCIGSSTSVGASSGVAWSGPICQTCSKPYLGTHACSPLDLMDRADELIRLARLAFERLNPTPTTGPVDRMASCPCRPANGGSGVCGCILGGPQVTC